MMAELGNFCLVAALLFSLLLLVIPTLGMMVVHFRPLAYNSFHFYVLGQFIFVSLAYCCLTACFLTDDFTVQYVVMNSSTHLLWFYKLCAVWGGHEGSMLLWVLILSIWMVAITYFSQSLDQLILAKVVVILGVISAGFFLFLLCTSNPFTRVFLDHTTGRDLNPLLQDPGFLFHPPMLYMGYVGFSVAFALGIAALWSGKMDAAWFKWARPWTLAAWSCLTTGITLGSWWAYRELGWGGFWFWDPVENASFMPWLVGCALVHTLALSERRQLFKSWTVLLCICSFSLSLIGTFLVRSGVLTSVHAFAVDPLRGLYILGFLVLIIGGSLFLFALRAHRLETKEQPYLFSKDGALLINTVILMVVMVSILLGTLYPLIIDGLGLGKLSVGAPYFNAIVTPFVFFLLAIMGFGVHLKWKQDTPSSLLSLCPLLIAAVLLAGGLVLWQGLNVLLFASISLCFWVIFSTIKLLIQKLTLPTPSRLSPSFLGMCVAHLGLVATVLGVSISSVYGIAKDVALKPGESVNLAGYQVTFNNETPIQGPNYHGQQATFSVSKGNHHRLIYPQKRIYNVGKMAMTESAIDAGLFRDIYVALGEPLDDTTWTVRLYYKPFIRWIWGGGLMILAGALLALADKRYYRSKLVVVSGVSCDV